MEWQWFLFLLPLMLIGGLLTLRYRLSRGQINPRPGTTRRRPNRSSDNSSTPADGAQGEGSGHHGSSDSSGGGDSGGHH
jgi:hypothetical protein